MTVVVIGCGPVALCAIICALEYHPSRIIAVDSVPDRLKRAEDLGCIPLNFKEMNVANEVMRLTEGNGAHAVIEVVGLSPALKTAYDVICPGGKISSVGKFLISPPPKSIRLLIMFAEQVYTMASSPSPRRIVITRTSTSNLEGVQQDIFSTRPYRG